MKRSIILILFINIQLMLLAQANVFNETYDSGDSLYNAADFIMQYQNSDNFLMQIKYFSLSATGTGLKLFEIDEFGEVLNEVDYRINNNRSIGTGAVEDDDKNIYSISIFRDSNENGRFDTYLMKLNANLDTIYSRVLDIGYDDGGGGISQKGENELIYLTTYYADSTILENSQVVMVTIDTLGNILDQWEYGGPSYDFAYDYKPTDDGGYIIGGVTRDSLMDDADLFLLKIDSNGTQEWYNKYGTTNEESVRTWNYIETTADGGYLIAGEEDIPTSGGSPTEIKGFIIKTDGNGIELWEEKIDINTSTTTTSSIRLGSGNSILLAGNLVNYNTAMPLFNDPRGYLHKYSSDGETLIWERFFSKFWQQDDYVHDMILTSDGGILVSGYILSAPNTANDAWLVKFDSCGYTVGDIPEPMLIIDSIKGKTVYITDQSTNYCTATLDWGDGTEEQAYYAYESNQPLAEKHFSHTYNQIDDYTITTTALAGEEFRDYSVQVLGLSNHSIGAVIPAQTGISLFPNPANDYVIIQNPYSSFVIPTTSTVIPATSTVIPAQAGISMSVYTLSGKQVKSINLNPKLYQQKIDVAALNNGVYYVRFEMDGVLVGTEKLVIAR